MFFVIGVYSQMLTLSFLEWCKAYSGCVCQAQAMLLNFQDSNSTSNFHLLDDLISATELILTLIFNFDVQVVSLEFQQLSHLLILNFEKSRVSNTKYSIVGQLKILIRVMKIRVGHSYFHSFSNHNFIYYNILGSPRLTNQFL